MTPQELKPPPQNIELEESLLAGCIYFDVMRESALDLISPEDFYNTHHQNLFAAIQSMTKAGISVDARSIADWVNSQGKMKSIGGAVTIAKLLDVPVPSNAEIYCDRLKRYSQLRKIAIICGKTLQDCYAGKIDDIDTVISNFQSQAVMAGEDLTVKFVTKEALSDESLARYESLSSGTNGPSLRTGFPVLDKVTGGGFRGSKLIIIAARPRVGKTALMCNFVENICRAGHGVGVFSLEMDRADLDDRWIASGANINAIKLTKEPGPVGEEWTKITNTVARQAQWKLLVDDNRADIHQLKRRIKQMVKQGVKIVFIDQLSGISGNRHKSAWERNTEHVEELKFLKKELRIPIVLLAQLNRDLEKRDNKKPRLSDLKNTGQLEEDADIVLLGHRPFLYAAAEGSNISETAAEWELAKNRQGVEWNIAMEWQGEYQRFREIAKEYSKREGSSCQGA